MTLKKLFLGTKLLSQTSRDKIASETFATDLDKEVLTDKERLIPQIDFSQPKNFAKYGSAQQYYRDSFLRIYDYYPFDGSQSEKQDWHNKNTYLDEWLYNNKYPKTTGYARLGTTGWNSPTYVTSAIGTGRTIAQYSGSSTASNEYILVKGGPNAGPAGDRVGANVYATSSSRSSNLRFGGEEGNTVEFILAKEQFLFTGSNASEVVFSIKDNNYRWCSILVNSGSSPASTGAFSVVLNISGTAFVHTFSTPTVDEVVDGVERHFAITIESDSAATESLFKLHVNGDLVSSSSYLTYIDEFEDPIYATIGGFVGSGSVSTGSGKLSGSLDEFRLWKTARTDKEIGRHWFTNVHGGTNSDDANTELGVYYKFNEGVYSSSSISTYDSIALDYSGRLSHGTWYGYTTSSRNTGSLVTNLGESTEEEDPILYASNALVSLALDDLVASGSEYDTNNNSSLYYNLPGWILEECEEKGNKTLLNLTQILASYFDSLHLQIEVLPRLIDKRYTEEGRKPFPFSNRFLSGTGLITPDIFTDSTILEELQKRTEDIMLEEKLHNTKNRIYENLYNNIVYILKSKGTEKSLRNLIRCFGTDDEIVKINLYASNTDYTLQNNTYEASARKNYINFNDPDRNDCVVFTDVSSSTSGSSPYISGSAEYTYIPQTVEAEVIFPKSFNQEDALYIQNTFITSSLFGIKPEDGSDAEVNIYAVRTYTESPDVYFVASSSIFSSVLTSSVYKNVYNNQKWNFAVRMFPEVDDEEVTAFWWDFYGTQYEGGTQKESFHVSESVAAVSSSMEADKRVYCGANRTNCTGSLILNCDVKISSVRYWFCKLDTDAVNYHASDPSTFGSLHPYREITTVANLLEKDSLVLHWDFATPQSASVSSGSDYGFYVLDASSGSADVQGRYNKDLDNVVDRHHFGHAYFFLQNDMPFDTEFLFAGKQQPAEQLSGADMVQIVAEDEEFFTTDTLPVKYFWSAEKSVYQSVSQEMLHIFASIKDFNNLIGDPVNRYRQTYKEIEKLRTLFFNSVENTPSVEKYIEYYKWIDSSIGVLLTQLVPATANFSEELRTVIESHVLERNKYWNKYPTLEMKHVDPEASIDPYDILGAEQLSVEDSIEPVGIKNIKIEDTLTEFPIETTASAKAAGIVIPATASAPGKSDYLGNYQKEYEIVSMSGKINQNSFFRQQNSLITKMTLPSPILEYDARLWGHVGASEDFSASLRPQRSHVIQERFSAPGDRRSMTAVYLDPAAQENSAYNVTTFRNLDVRTAYNIGLSSHVISGGLDKDGIASVHKTPRNASHVMRYSGSNQSVISGTQYDNGFIVRQIPQNIYGYWWIGSSVSASAPSEYAIGLNEYTDGYQTSSIVPWSATVKTINLVGYTKEVDPTENLLTFPATHISWSVNYASPYQGASWEQTRLEEHEVARYLRNHNIISLPDPPRRVAYSRSGISLTGLYLISQEQLSSTFTNYYEPPITWNYPMVHKLFDPEGKIITVTHTNLNLLEKYANKDLANYTGDKDIVGPTMYSKLLELYDGDPEDKFVFISLSAREQIYPKHQNSCFDIVRTRGNYICSYWRDSAANRIEAPFTNSLGYVINETSSVNPLEDGLNSSGLGEINSMGSARLLDLLVCSANATASIQYSYYYDEPIEFSLDSDSGKKPWYDSHDDFYREVRLINQRGGVVPEFRVSEHMDYYLNEASGNFRSVNTAMMTMEGGRIESSSMTNRRTINDEFYKIYSHSDFLKTFSGIVEDHKNVEGIRKTFSLTCNAVKKLLPYYGFYPMHRSIQLAQLFSQSYAPYVTGCIDMDNRAGTMQALLQPFYAPGIFYNTMKSGIAVDWNTYTGSFDLGNSFEQNYSSGAINVYSSFRLPFESIITPGEYLPIDDSGQQARDKQIYGVYPEFFEHDKARIGSVTMNQSYTTESVNVTIVGKDGDGYSTGGFNRYKTISYDADNNKFLCVTNGTGTVGSRPPPNFYIYSSGTSGWQLEQDLSSSIWGIDEREDDYNSTEGATTPYHRYVVNLGNEWAFIRYYGEDNDGGAPGQQINTGTIDVFHSSSGPGWEFSQTLFVTGSHWQINCDFDKENNKFVAGSCGDLGDKKVRVYSLSGSTWVLEQEITCSATASRTNGGYGQGPEIAISGNCLAVPHYLGMNDGLSRIFIYNFVSSSWVESQQIVSPFSSVQSSGSDNSVFGYSLQLKNNRLLTFGAYDATLSSGLVCAVYSLASGTFYLEGSVEVVDPVSTGSISEGDHIRFINNSSAFYFLNRSIASAGNGYLTICVKNPVTNLWQKKQTITGSTGGYFGTSADSDGGKLIIASSGSTVVYPDIYTADRWSPYFTWIGQSKLNYSLAAHNFFAEVPKFFLKENKFLTLTSKKESEFGTMLSGTTYFMDINLYDSDRLDMVKAYDSDYDGKHFGPPVFSYGEESSGTYENTGVSYAPYTPPYFYGKSLARMYFTATRTRKYSLSEIFSGLVTLNHNESLNLNAKQKARLEQTYIDQLSSSINGNTGLFASINFSGDPRDYSGYATRMIGTVVSSDLTFSFYHSGSNPNLAYLQAYVGDAKNGEVASDVRYFTGSSGANEIYVASGSTETWEMSWPASTFFTSLGLMFADRSLSGSYTTASYSGVVFSGSTEMYTLVLPFSGTADEDSYRIDYVGIVDIKSAEEVENLVRLNHNYFYPALETDLEALYKYSPTFSASMEIPASINLKGISRDPEATFGVGQRSNTNAVSSVEGMTTSPNTSYDRWVISPRFEAPVLTLADKSNPSNESVGLWGSYGSIPSGSEGVFVSIGDSYRGIGEEVKNLPANVLLRGSDTSVIKVGSLLNICGFEPQTRRVGEFATMANIKEAVVAIPFVDSNLGSDVVTRVANRYFFKIYRNKINELDSQGKVTSLTKMMRAAQRYVLPPEFDFTTYGEVSPFVMYFFEFDQLFDQQDLSDIWQGVMPKPARISEKVSRTITHEFAENEFLGGLTYPKETRWMVFKVKQKAEKNYYKMTADSKDDARFTFRFSNGRTGQPDYSYNWPYDYCSLVEIADVTAQLLLDRRATAAPEPPPLTAPPTNETADEPGISRVQMNVENVRSSIVNRGVARAKK